jgi:hypothetical protein
MWRLRAGRELPRFALAALSIAGLLAGARVALDPPRPAGSSGAARPTVADLAAEAYAVLFTRRYLTWNASEPLASVRALEPFAGAQLEPGAGLVLPPSGRQDVQWAEVAQAREPAPGVHVYTVAAQTDTAGLQYLTVGVRRTAAGSLALTGYPAFAGPPASSAALQQSHLSQVNDPALATVVRRALGNYLSDSTAELAADLSAGARVAVPAEPLQAVASGRLQWARGGGSVLAEVQASDARGARYTLAYEIDVIRAQGRWEISAIQTDPNG